MLAVLSGCDDGSAATPDGGAVATTARFELGPDPLDFGAIPFPDDLYLDERGRIALGALPGEERAFPEDFPDSMREALGELTGFSTVAPIYFYFPPGSLDPTSLPASPAESAREDSTVFLVDADPASPAAFTRVPISVRWHAERGQLALRPADGQPLVPGRRYAAIVTSGVRDVSGAPIGPAPRFAAIRDAASRPSEPVDAEAYDRYTPVLASLASNGAARERVAALAVFTVQPVAPDLRDARAIVWEGEPPSVRVDAALASGPALDALLGVPALDAPGVDVPGGVQHDHLGWLVQGRFRAPNLLAAEAEAHGGFSRDADGRLEVKRKDEIPFTLTLPSGDLAELPLVVFQHGLGAERSDMLAIADALAAAGWATIAIDIPFHGMRARGDVVDVGHRFGPSAGPDGFGDRRGEEIYLDYFGILETGGPLPGFHPVYVRDALRQSVVDLMTLVRVVREGDWSEVRETAGLEGLGFGGGPLAFVGVSLGGIVGTVFVASEPEVGAAVLTVTGGDLSRLVERSAAFADLFLGLLAPRLGIETSSIDPVAYPASFQPELALFQTVLDAGDSIAFAPALARGEVNLLFQMAEHDEVVPNRATEALARTAGSAIIDADPVHTSLSRAAAPVVGNVEVMAQRVTRGLYRFAPATHGLLSSRSGQHAYAHPPAPPFEAISPVTVDNPIDAALEQLLHFLQTWRGGAAEVIAPRR